MNPRKKIVVLRPNEKFERRIESTMKHRIKPGRHGNRLNIKSETRKATHSIRFHLKSISKNEIIHEF